MEVCFTNTSLVRIVSAVQKSSENRRSVSRPSLAKSRLSEKAEEANQVLLRRDCLELLVRQDILLSPDMTFLTDID